MKRTKPKKNWVEQIGCLMLGHQMKDVDPWTLRCARCRWTVTSLKGRKVKAARLELKKATEVER